MVLLNLERLWVKSGGDTANSERKPVTISQASKRQVRRVVGSKELQQLAMAEQSRSRLWTAAMKDDGRPSLWERMRWMNGWRLCNDTSVMHHWITIPIGTMLADIGMAGRWCQQWPSQSSQLEQCYGGKRPGCWCQQWPSQSTKLKPTKWPGSKNRRNSRKYGVLNNDDDDDVNANTLVISKLPSPNLGRLRTRIR